MSSQPPRHAIRSIQEVSEIVGLSKSRVQAIESSALRKMRESLESFEEWRIARRYPEEMKDPSWHTRPIDCMDVD